MKVLLLNPVMRDGTRSLRVCRCQGKVIVGLWPNIEHGYAASLLITHGFNVTLLDANHLGWSFDRTLRTAVSLAPDVVIILSITASIEDDLELARRIKALRPNTFVVFWGTHATVRPQDYLETPGNIVIRREPEVALLDVCLALREGSLPVGIPGVSVNSDGAIMHGPDRPFLKDIDSLPMPSHLLMRTGSHLATDSHRPFALIKTSRGCPHGCVFCTTHVFHGSKWRARSPQSIVEEMQLVYSSTGIRDFFLQSDVFEHSRAWAIELAERIIKAGLEITWFANSRADAVDIDLLRLFKRSGCRMLAFGLESGSDAVLKACRKGTNAAAGARAIQACREAGIRTLTYFVFGLPGETNETIKETLDFIRAIRPDYAHFYAPTPLPGTRLFQEWRVMDRIMSGEIKWADFFQGASTRFLASTVSREDVESALRQAWTDFYLDPRRLLHEAFSIRALGHLIGRAETVANMVKNYVLMER